MGGEVVVLSGGEWWDFSGLVEGLKSRGSWEL